MKCDRPECSAPATHEVSLGGRTVAGWERVCCKHADHLMIIAAQSVDPTEGARGLASWGRKHAATECTAVTP